MSNPVPRDTSNDGGSVPSRTMPRRSKKPWVPAVAPALLIVLVGLVVPFGRVLQLAFSNEDGGYTMDNMVRLWGDSALWSAARNSLILVVLSTIAHVGLGLLLAVLLNRADLPRSYVSTMRTAFLIPWALSPVVVAIIWRLFLQPQLSAVGDLLGALPLLKDGVLGNPQTAMAGVLIANIWFATPFYLMNLLARLQGIPDDLYEAAATDGAGPLRRFVHITLPSVRDMAITLAVFDVIITFATFDLIWLMTRGGPLGATEVITTYLYKIAFRQFDFEYAGAISLVLLAAIALMSAAIWRLKER